MLADACCPGMLSKGANAPSLVPMCVASGQQVVLGIQGAARTGGQRESNCYWQEGSYLFTFELGTISARDMALNIY